MFGQKTAKEEINKRLLEKQSEVMHWKQMDWGRIQ